MKLLNNNLKKHYSVLNGIFRQSKFGMKLTENFKEVFKKLIVYFCLHF